MTRHGQRDITPAMIAQAREWQVFTGLSNLAWHIGDAMALPFEDGCFERVTTPYSFHHMPDPAAGLAEMTLVCREDGRIVVIDATASPETQSAYDEMERLRDSSHASALTLDQRRRVGAKAGLRELLVDSYRLEARLDTLADAKDIPAPDFHVR